VTIQANQIETRYAKSGELNIAYQQYGAGPVRLVYVPGWASHVENAWTFPEHAEFSSALARFARVIMLDRRGTGLSDPVAEPPTLEERMDDVRAVMDAAGWDRAAIWGISEGGPMAMLFAATYPERTQALVLYGTFARFTRSADYPIGYPPEVAERFLETVASSWGTGELSRGFAPARADDPAAVRDLARLERMSMSPGTAYKLFRNLVNTDLRDVLPAIRVPTLLLHRVDDLPIRVAHARYLAEHLPHARYVELPGSDHLPFVGDHGALLAEVREFLTGERAAPEADRVLTTILFCDIVDSTARAAALGAAPGATCWRASTPPRTRSSAPTAGASSTPRATACTRPSTGPRARCAAARRCAPRSRRSACRCASACTPASARCSTTSTAASRSTSARAWRAPRARARCS